MKHPDLPLRLRRGVVTLLAALAAAGCAVGPDYQKPQDAPVTLASPEQALFSTDRVQADWWKQLQDCLLYTSPSPRDVEESRMPSSA